MLSYSSKTKIWMKIISGKTVRQRMADIWGQFWILAFDHVVAFRRLLNAVCFPKQFCMKCSQISS